MIKAKLMKVNCLLPVVVLSVAFSTGCLVLGAPRHVYLRDPARQDSIMLTSFPNGFYQYSLFSRNAKIDSMHIYYPIRGKTVAMNKRALNFHYDLRAKGKQRGRLSTTVVHRFCDGHTRLIRCGLPEVCVNSDSDG